MNTELRKTFWWQVTMNNDLDNPRQHEHTFANETPRMLHWLLEPHEDTHRVIKIRRERTASGNSVARIVMAGISDPDDQVILHTLLCPVV